MTLGEKILYLRKKAGLSQEELAEVVSVSRQAVSKWETGEATPEVGKLLLLSRAFGVTADWLLSDEGPEDETAYTRTEPEPPPPTDWTETIPGLLGKLLNRFGWLVGIYVAVVGGAFTLFGVLARALTRGVESFSAGNMPESAILGGGNWEFADDFSQQFFARPVTSPFTTFGNIFIGIGLVLLIGGVILAVWLKRRSDHQ